MNSICHLKARFIQYILTYSKNIKYQLQKNDKRSFMLKICLLFEVYATTNILRSRWFSIYSGLHPVDVWLISVSVGFRSQPETDLSLYYYYMLFPDLNSNGEDMV